MMRFYAQSFTIAMRDITMCYTILTTIMRDRGGETKFSDIGGIDRDEIAKALASVVQEISRIPVSAAVRAQADQLSKSLKAPDDEHLTVSRAELLLKTLQNGILVDLAAPWFLLIPSERAGYYQQAKPPFGQEVIDRFPKTDGDIGAAARCLALDEWTAAVFHLMRVMEHGLRSLATELNISTPDIVSYQDWHNIIDQIESEIKNLDKTLPRGPDKSKRLEFYSRATTGFSLAKNAWRNHVSHSRITYDQREAESIFTQVRASMQALADGPR